MKKERKIGRVISTHYEGKSECNMREVESNMGCCLIWYQYINHIGRSDGRKNIVQGTLKEVVKEPLLTVADTVDVQLKALSPGECTLQY